MRWTKKNLLGIRELSEGEIHQILDKSSFYKEKWKHRKMSIYSDALPLKNRTAAIFFFEPSTRTRMSFELAAQSLGVKVLELSVSKSSFQKNETLRETLENLKSLGIDFIVIRHYISGFFKQREMPFTDGIINAGDGMNEHPTQALTDLFTIFCHKGDVRSLKIAIVGDVAHSRVARSYIWAFTKMGAEVFLIAPQNMLPAEVELMNVRVSYDMEKIFPDMDVVIMLRVQVERQEGIFSVKDYAQSYGLRSSMESFFKRDAIILHPGPVCVGTELDKDLLYGDRSLVFQEVENSVCVRMAILDLIASVL